MAAIHHITPSARYREGVASGHWQHDDAQQIIVAEFDRLHTALYADKDKIRKLRWLLRWLPTWSGNSRQSPIPGLYLWGSVGRGKTFLMDLFTTSMPRALVKRQHFHHFMGDVHAHLRKLKQHPDPLLTVAADMAQQYRVLCLDEFLVNDIGDAMILAKLLDTLFARGVSLVTTANTHPDQLYRDGLQRARFLPAISLIKQHCHVIEINTAHDWRRRTRLQAKLYYTPADASAEQALAGLFRHQAQGQIRDLGNIMVNDRPIPILKCADKLLWIDFKHLCAGPRSVADYIELAGILSMLIISGVPQFTADNEDAAKRFIHLVDELYDRRVKLALSAAAPLARLYLGERLRTEFARTESRLIEMQSQAYLDLPTVNTR